jgi:hypothetical protein
MPPTPGAVPDLFPGAPQREAGLDLHAIAGRPSTTPWLRSYLDAPPRARSAPRAEDLPEGVTSTVACPGCTVRIYTWRAAA